GRAIDFQRTPFFDHFIAFEVVADFDVVESFDGDPALVSILDLSNIVLEALERADLAVIDDHAVANDPEPVISPYATFDDIASCHGACARYFEYLADLGRADRHLLLLRRQEAFQRIAHVFDGVIDDGIRPDVDLLALGQLACADGRSNLESDDDGIGRRSEHDVAFGDGANTAVNDVQRHLVRAELEQGIGECLYRATHIRLDDELQLLEIAKRKPAADFVERDVFLLAKRLLAMDLLSSLGDVAYLLFIVQYDELVAGFGSAVEAQNQRGLRGPRYIQTIIALIEHRTDAAAVDAGNERIADMKRAVLHENGRHDAPALFEARLDHHAVCVSVRIRPELQQLGLEQNAVEQVIHTFPVCADTRAHCTFPPYCST